MYVQLPYLKRTLEDLLNKVNIAISRNMLDREKLSWVRRVIRSKLFDGLVNLAFHLREQNAFRQEVKDQ